jgi:hypothetical protein
MFTQFKNSKLNNDQLAALRGGCPNGCDEDEDPRAEQPTPTKPEPEVESPSAPKK